MNQKQMKEFMKALDAIVEEKKVDKKIVVEAMEQAMATAYKKNEGITNVMAKVDDVTGDIKIYSYKTVVETVENPELEISLDDANKEVEGIELGEEEKFKIYVGDKVINLKNDRTTVGYDVDTKTQLNEVKRPIYNGNIGEVVEIIDDKNVIVDFYNVGQVLLKEKQLRHIALGYAITVHKLQGSTIPYVIGCVDYSHYTMLNRQLVYTLMSRAKYELRFIFETNALLKAISTNKVSTKRTFLYHFLIGELE